MLALVTLAGCASDDGAVAVTLADFSITPDPSTAPSGTVTFTVENTAAQVHELVVAATDLAADALPTGDDGDVSEEGATDLRVIDEIEDIAAGDTQELVVTLDPGHYVLFCNLPEHYGNGMSADFTVS